MPLGVGRGQKHMNVDSGPLHMSYMYVHRCIVLTQASTICKSFCLFYPSAPSFRFL